MRCEENWATKRELAATYDAIAGEYTAKFGDMLAQMPFDRELLDAFASASVGPPVVDAGSGPGQVAKYLCGRGLRLVAFDLSAQMALRAREHTACTLVADLAQLPFASASLGGLVAFYSIICVPRAGVPAILAEFRRVLLPAAPVVVSFHVGRGEEHHSGWSMSYFEPSEMVSYARRVGFEVTGCEERPPYAFEKQGGHAYLKARA